MLARRIEYAANWSETNVILLGGDDFQFEASWLRENLEPFEYGAADVTGTQSVLADQASCGLSFVCRTARRHGVLAYLSGTGADEVYSDYGHGGERFCPQSSFGGDFPADLGSVFPWRGFFLGTQRDYLMKEELVAGAHGVEGRYPLLEPRVVQEFLWLAPELKNQAYKAALGAYLEGAGYPFERGIKRGFSAAANNPPGESIVLRYNEFADGGADDALGPAGSVLGQPTVEPAVEPAELTDVQLAGQSESDAACGACAGISVGCRCIPFAAIGEVLVAGPAPLGSVRNITAILHAEEGTLFFAANRIAANRSVAVSYSWQNEDDWAEAAFAELQARKDVGDAGVVVVRRGLFEWDLSVAAAADGPPGEAWLFLGGEKLSIQVRSWAALEDAREELREFFLQSYYRAHGCFVCQNIYDADW